MNAQPIGRSPVLRLLSSISSDGRNPAQPGQKQGALKQSDYQVANFRPDQWHDSCAPGLAYIPPIEALVVAALRQQCEATNSGSLTRGEATLTAQANTLNALFVELVQRAAMNFGQDLPRVDTYLRLALKAQGQCRTTWEAIAEIKNPRSVAFVKQANIANGPQQVNNGSPEVARAGKTENEQSKLSGANNELLPDTRAPGLEGAVNQALETVGAVNRTEDCRG